MRFQPGDRVVFEDSHGTITRRVTPSGESSAWYVRWDNGRQGIAWAADLQPEGERDG